MAVKKINKDFVLSDSTVNVYGFRLLTAGCVLEEVLKNPIGYYGHDYDDGILVRWEDVRIEGDRILGKPVINMEHPRAARTVKEIEEGFLSAASVGNICLLEHEFEENPEDAENPILVGTKWYYKECSLVDSPGNRSAFKLYDSNDQELSLPNLKDDAIKLFNKNQTSDMKEIQLKITAELVTMLNLSDKADSAELQSRIKDLHDKAEATASENVTLKTEVKDLKDAATSKEVADILEKGLADKKLTVALKDALAKDYATKPKELKSLVDAMPKFSSIVDKIADKKTKDVSDLADMDYDALDKADKLQDLMDNNPEVFAEKYKTKFKKEYKG